MKLTDPNDKNQFRGKATNLNTYFKSKVHIYNFTSKLMVKVVAGGNAGRSTYIVVV